MTTTDKIVISTYVIGLLISCTVILAIRKKMVQDKGTGWELDVDDYGVTIFLSLIWPAVFTAVILFFPLYGIYKLVDFVSDKLLWAYKEATNPKENV